MLVVVFNFCAAMRYLKPDVPKIMRLLLSLIHYNSRVIGRFPSINKPIAKSQEPRARGKVLPARAILPSSAAQLAFLMVTYKIYKQQQVTPKLRLGTYHRSPIKLVDPLGRCMLSPVRHKITRTAAADCALSTI